LPNTRPGAPGSLYRANGGEARRVGCDDRSKHVAAMDVLLSRVDPEGGHVLVAFPFVRQCATGVAAIRTRATERLPGSIQRPGD
jgi:hypothetical protein